MKAYRSRLGDMYFKPGGIRDQHVKQGLIDDKAPVSSAEEGYPLFINGEKIPCKIIR